MGQRLVFEEMVHPQVMGYLVDQEGEDQDESD